MGGQYSGLINRTKQTTSEANKPFPGAEPKKKIHHKKCDLLPQYFQSKHGDDFHMVLWL